MFIVNIRLQDLEKLSSSELFFNYEAIFLTDYHWIPPDIYNSENEVVVIFIIKQFVRLLKQSGEVKGYEIIEINAPNWDLLLTLFFPLGNTHIDHHHHVFCNLNWVIAKSNHAWSI